MKRLINKIVFSVKDATLFCKKATLLIEKSYAHPLSARERFQLKIHLKICINCSRYQKQSFLIEYALRNDIHNFQNHSAFKLSDASKIRIKTEVEKNLTKN